MINSNDAHSLPSRVLELFQEGKYWTLFHGEPKDVTGLAVWLIYAARSVPRDRGLRLVMRH